MAGTGPEPAQPEVSVYTSDGRLLVSWQPEAGGEKAVPQPAKPAGQPEEITSNEQLYLTGLHLEQYRHATYDPRPYYEEALRRDPKDSRCANALGLWYLRRGRFTKAEAYFRTAIATLTERNPNPLDGEPYFNLGLALCFQERDEEAYPAFYKSVWNAAWMDSGYLRLAQLAAKKQDWDDALDLIDRSLIRNGHHHKARHLKVSILRKAGRIADALALAEESLLLDRFNFGILYEKVLLAASDAGRSSAEETLKSRIRGNIHTHIEFALDYAQAGLYQEAAGLIQAGVDEQGGKPVYPMALYYKAWFEWQQDRKAAALEALKQAFELDTTDARILMELDQLYKRLKRPAEERLNFFLKYPELVDDRDDLYLERVTLYNQLGEHEKAFDLIMSRRFHPWEGGEGKVTGQYVYSLVSMARKAIQTGAFAEAVRLLEQARSYPENLGEGKLYGAQENEILYWLGIAHEQLGEKGKAQDYWQQASKGLKQVSSAIFYNDQQPDTIFYQGLALRKLGQEEEAKKRFQMLVSYGEQHLNDQVKIDYFAVSLPDLQIWEDDLNKRNRQLCQYLMDLENTGLQNA